MADEVVAFAREQLERQRPGEPAESLGVGTFNLRQQLAIQDELEVRRRDDPSIEPFFDRGRARAVLRQEPREHPGRRARLDLPQRHVREGRGRRTALQLRPAERRERVAAAERADHAGPSRDASVLVDSRNDINPASATSGRPATASRVPRLRGARPPAGARGTQHRLARSRHSSARSMQELAARGLTLQPQVGVAGYRIDLGVLDRDVPGRFVCGIECDGVAYHASETARDRDRLRQQVLEARGWTLLPRVVAPTGSRIAQVRSSGSFGSSTRQENGRRSRRRVWSRSQPRDGGERCAGRRIAARAGVRRHHDAAGRTAVRIRRRRGALCRAGAARRTAGNVGRRRRGGGRDRVTGARRRRHCARGSNVGYPSWYAHPVTDHRRVYTRRTPTCDRTARGVSLESGHDAVARSRAGRGARRADRPGRVSGGGDAGAGGRS